MDPETVAAIIRVTGGNFCLLGRLFKQAHRILEINGLTRMNATVIDAARESRDRATAISCFVSAASTILYSARRSRILSGSCRRSKTAEMSIRLPSTE